MARRRARTVGSAGAKGSGRTSSGNWPQVRGGKNFGRSVNGGARQRKGGKRGEATSAFPTVEWPFKN